MQCAAVTTIFGLMMDPPMETVQGALTSLLPVNAIVGDWAGRVPQEPPSAVRISGTSGGKVKTKTDVCPVCLSKTPHKV